MSAVTIAACALNGQNQIAYVQNIFFFFCPKLFAIMDYRLVGNFCGTKLLLWCNLFILSLRAAVSNISYKIIIIYYFAQNKTKKACHTVGKDFFFFFFLNL